MFRIKLLVGSCLLMVMAAFPTPAHAASPGQSGRIAFLITRDGGNRDIFTMAPNGADVRQLTNDPTPSARLSPGMAYDAARGRVVLFGGVDVNVFGDTWTWNGTDWTKRSPVLSPSAGSGMGMAYDAARHRVVLFNGNGFGDTWTWNGTDWRKRTPVHSPPARSDMGMAYDAARGRVVLFGGSGASGLFGDTWTWNGRDWRKRTPAHAPSARAFMGMAYYGRGRRIVLFGGRRGPDCVKNLGYLSDTWTWDGKDWRKRKPAHRPTCLAFMGMSKGHGQIVLFGGLFGGEYPSDQTWTWDGTDWTLRSG